MESTTPRARPQLSSFSNRKYTASPLGPQNRLSTPQPQRQQPTARKLTTREEFARGALNASAALRPTTTGSVGGVGGGGGSGNNNPTTTSSTSARAAMPDIFAPGASPAVRKTRASATASPSPSPARNAPSKSTRADLFVQRIPDPPQDLTGEALVQQIPRHLESRGTVYADQYLAHLVPKDFSDEQRRQFFCILDLRRLKVAATEIFAKKDWKLNIMNFAKEFEKSRSMIMLRYGLYEFKNVKPSAEVLRKWRAAHGLPEPTADDGAAAEGTRQNGFPTAAKRKAEEQLTRDTALSTGSPDKSKRRAFTVDDSSESDKSPNKNKRKARVSGDDIDQQTPSKLHKPQPASASSATKSLFQSIADNSGTFRTPDSGKPAVRVPGTAPAPKMNLFGAEKPNPNLFASASKPTASGPASSIFHNLKPCAPKAGETAGNIFSYLSDNSAKNSFVEPDSSGEETDDAAEAPASSGPAANGPFNASMSTAGLFGTNPSSNTATRESTPSRSLFDRVGGPSQGKGEEKLAPKSVEKPAPTNQTWSAGTPIKFAPSGSAATPSVLGASTTAQFTKDSDASKTLVPLSSSQPNAPFQSTAGLFGSTGAPSTPQPTTSSVFDKAKADAAPKTAPPKPSAGLFGVSAEPAEEKAPAAPALSFSQAPSAIFGPPNTSNKSGLFQGSYTAPSFEKPAASPAPIASPPPEKKPEPTEAVQPPPSAIFGPPVAGIKAGLFQGSYKPASEAPTASTSTPAAAAPAAATGLFGVSKPNGSSSAPSPAAGLFGGSKPLESTPSTGGLFGVSKPAEMKPTPALFGASTTSDITKPATTGLFGASTTAAPSTAGLFGASTTSAAPSTAGLFGASTAAPATANLFGASTPAAPSSSALFAPSQPARPTTPPKPAARNSAAPIFSFNAPTTASKPVDTANLFGANNSATFGSPMKTDNSPVKKPAPAPASAGSIFSFGASNPAPASSAPVFFGSGSGASVSQPAASAAFGNTSFAPSTAAPPSLNTSFTGFQAGGGASQSFNNPFNNVAGSNPPSATSSFDFNFGGGDQPASQSNGNASFTFGAANPITPTATTPSTNNKFSFTGGDKTPSGRVIATPRRRGASPALNTVKKPLHSVGGGAGASSQPSFSFTAATPQIGLPQPSQQPPFSQSFSFGASQQQQPQQQQQPASSIFANLQSGGPSTSGANSPLVFGGGSSVATTPAVGTPEPSSQAATEAGDAEAPLEQINLVSGGPGEEDETVLHEVRAKALKYIAPGKDDDDGKKSATPWTTQGIGPLRLLQNKKTNSVRLLLRAQPSGNVALNRSVLPGEKHQVTEKYVKITTTNDSGNGLETWMLQVKTKEMAAELAAALEKHKGANKTS